MTMKKTISVLAGALALALTLAACGNGATAPGGDTTSEPTASPSSDVHTAHNSADTEFAQMMIVHHEGAVEMADLAVERAGSEEVRALAEGISAAQGPEIEKMTAWLEAWGEDVSPAVMDGMDHGEMDMNGMSQKEAMDDLGGRNGDAFDRAFLETMIAHHEGAVDMAQAELDAGENPEALELARQIITDQEAEIAEMTAMLPSL